MLTRLALEVNSLSIHLGRYARRTDVALGVPPARLSALSVLVFGGDRTLTELADAEQVSAPTMSRVVDGLEAMGLAKRMPNPADARSSVIRATAKGRRVMERGRQARVDWLSRVLDAVPPDELPTVERALQLLREALSQTTATASRS